MNMMNRKDRMDGGMNAGMKNDGMDKRETAMNVNEKETIPCAMVQDLLPAYIEGLAGDEPVQTGVVTPKEPDTVSAPADDSPRRPYIDSTKCLSCGACVGIDDKTFGFNEDGQAVIIREDATSDDCREAAEACPAGCIVIN